ncbi:MAG: CG33251-PA [uncultured Actinomycetospora sp.]|uniref:CG33251-PA n=1 Tax=uncultured Actinomycetospora sp. TaxID=1135996 RepID=A0A6J4HZK0_9PSEU|nr:MAG: CG33251-PA [uncultured Actinomycetospora sp.]
MIDNNQTQSFDRMRSMLVRAAEVRDSEQQQIFDSLDEIHGRLAALDGLGAIRKRLSDVPDRTEMSVLAERLDETVAKIDAQESSISSLARLVEGLVDRVADRLATPFAQLDGRLDGVTGRFEGVAGRMDGLEDRLSGLHKRLDDLDNRLDRHEMRLDGLPAAVTGPMRERIDGVDAGLRDRLEDLARGVSEEITGTREAARTDATTTRSESATQLGELQTRLEAITTRLDEVGTRLDGVESGLGERVGALSTSVEHGLDRLDGTLVNRPDHEAVVALVRQANEESERRNAGHLDEAMATFAEIILGPGGGSSGSMPGPRPTARRGRKSAVRDGQVNGAELPTEDISTEG